MLLPSASAVFTAKTTGSGTFTARTVFGLTQTAPCFTHDASGGCGSAVAIRQTENMSISPDGKHLYAAAHTDDAVAQYARNLTTGALTALAAPNQCVSNAATTGCTTAAGLDRAYDVVVSPDGNHVYAAGYASDAVAAFSRDATTGALTQLAAPNRCVSNAAITGCTTGRALDGADGVAISPDGAFVYVAAYTSSAVTVFSRNSTTGVLTQLAGTAGCIADTSSTVTGCTAAVGLKNPYFLQVSPDGRSVYAAANGSSAVPVLQRNTTTGVLTQAAAPNACVYNTGSTAITGCTAAVGLSGVYNVRVSPDNSSVYALGYDGDTIAALSRNTTTGVLTQLAGPNACLYLTGGTAPAGCTAARAIDAPTGLSFTPDGRHLFVSAYTSGAVAVFRRGTTGVLTQLTGTNGCFAVSVTGCATGKGVQLGLSVLVSPDGRDVYVGGGQPQGTGQNPPTGNLAVLNWTH